MGNALLQRLNPKDCVIFSRDELKQARLKKEYPEITTILGDVRDKDSLVRAMKRIDVVYHVAALKHVDILEHNVEECIKTNILGTINSIEAAKENLVSKFFFTSTDKAVLPINVYGMSKAISENYVLSKNSPFLKTNFYVMRWGNILGSRGSAISEFARTLKDQKVAYVTHPEMTRFWMRIEDAVEFMLEHHPKSDKVLIPKMKSAKTTEVIKAVADCLGIYDFKTLICGIRPGEKIHECLYSNHDFCIRSDISERWTHDELVEMIKPLVCQ